MLYQIRCKHRLFLNLKMLVEVAYIDEHTMSHLELCLKLPAEKVEQLIDFWASKGILKRFGNIVLSLENCSKERLEQLDTESGLVAVKDTPETEVKGNEHLVPMILGMLKNLGPSRIEVIHNTLAMFCMEPFPYQLSQIQLEAMLRSLIDQNLLELEEALYQVP